MIMYYPHWSFLLKDALIDAYFANMHFVFIQNYKFFIHWSVLEDIFDSIWTSVRSDAGVSSWVLILILE